MVYSANKHIDGQGHAMGGAILGDRIGDRVQSHWRPERKMGTRLWQSAVIWIRVRDAGDYIHVPDFSHARPMTKPVGTVLTYHGYDQCNTPGVASTWNWSRAVNAACCTRSHGTVRPAVQRFQPFSRHPGQAWALIGQNHLGDYRASTARSGWRSAASPRTFGQCRTGYT